MTLGVLGGLGPMSSVYFYELLTSLTAATCDQEHLDVLISSRATTPDRTDFILGRSTLDPAPVMIEEARRLERAGADLIAIPCNTAHFFYHQVRESVGIPILDIIEETCRCVAESGARSLGLLATEGTVSAGSYRVACEKMGLLYLAPLPGEQELISNLIYKQIKRGEKASPDDVLRVADALCARGAERVVLGCTELSLLTRQYSFDARFVDSLHALARTAILRCGKQLTR